VLLTSGYTDNAIVHHGRLDQGVMLLTKPYRKPQLDQMVRQALAGPGSELRPDRIRIASPARRPRA
jgi:hypothetical protein